MFEYESGFTISPLSEAASFPADVGEGLGAKIVARSNLIWQEHCSECAMPSCYSSCMFYAPRRDYKCRRFQQPVEINQSEEHTRIVARVSFGKWARLLAYGPQPPKSVPESERRERRTIKRYRVEQALAFTRGILAPVNRKLGNRRWQKKFRSQRECRYRFLLLEVFNPRGTIVDLTVSLSRVDESGSPIATPTMATARLSNGYNVGWIHFPDEPKNGTEEATYCVAISPSNPDQNPTLTFGLVDVVEFESPPAATSSNCVISQDSAANRVKCVVWDLDNTLWRGILVEDGIERLELNSVALDAIRRLDSRGILNSIASKNDPEPAIEALEKFKIDEYFLCPQISWGPKSVGVREIARSLNLGIDTFAFVDDQPFEREEVSSQFPDVTVIDPDDLSNVLASDRFSGDQTTEASSRRTMYIQEEKRKEKSEEFRSDYEAFIKSCEMEVEIQELTRDSLQRAYELSQRTNQLNIATTRYTKEDLNFLAFHSSEHEVHVVTAKDKFGDYGIVGLCVFSLETNLIKDLMFSCRIQSKFVDDTYLAWLSERTREVPGHLKARYCETDRNGPARQMLIRAGFQACENDGEPWEMVSNDKSLEHFREILMLSVPER